MLSIGGWLERDLDWLAMGSDWKSGLLGERSRGEQTGCGDRLRTARTGEADGQDAAATLHCLFLRLSSMLREHFPTFSGFFSAESRDRDGLG